MLYYLRTPGCFANSPGAVVLFTKNNQAGRAFHPPVYKFLADSTVTKASAHNRSKKLLLSHNTGVNFVR